MTNELEPNHAVGLGADQGAQSNETISPELSSIDSRTAQRPVLPLVAVFFVLTAVVALFFWLYTNGAKTEIVGVVPEDVTKATTTNEAGAIDEEQRTQAPEERVQPHVESDGTIVFPEGSSYSYRYDRVYYTRPGGDPENYADYKSFTVDSGTFEYLNEDIVKDATMVYYQGEPQHLVDPADCVLEDLDACTLSGAWRNKVEPYELEVAWSGGLKDASAILPSPQNLCLAPGYEVGTVTNGALAGSPFLMQMNEICDMHCGGWYLRNVAHYVQYDGQLLPVADGNGFVVPELATSSETDRLAIPGSSSVLVREGVNGLFTVGERSSGEDKLLFVHPTVGPVYRNTYACFRTKRADHAEVVYSLELPFAYDRGDGSVPFTKLDGAENEEVYKVYRDYSSCLHVVDGADLEMSRLTEAGEFANGEKVFRLADANDQRLVDLYNAPNTMASYQDGKNKYSYAEFLAFNPYLYWKDPFGDWVEFLNHRFELAAEKCKPVIYLYPEDTGEFRVTVEPNGGFTQTIPEYGVGWQVTATPESVITDRRTGEEYPYLYWEGVNSGIPEIAEGWVVAKEDVEELLSEKLTLLGLNESEIVDFNEYWVDRLTTADADYFKIMFVPQAVFDQLSPLTVTGDDEPDSIIRVMMYAQPTVANTVLPEQELPSTPKRDGFTVVEWGGALLH